MSVANAGALDQPITGTKLALRTAKGVQTLTFLSKDPTLALPAIGSPGDPATGGFGIELWTMTPRLLASLLEAPAGSGWTSRQTPTVTYQYRNASGLPGGIRRMVLQQGRQLRVTSSAGATPGPLGGVGLVFLFPSGDRRCVFFGPDTIVQDVPGRFVAKNAATVPTDCSQVLPTTTTTTPTTSTTTTTLPGTCGDGVVNQSSEACDGTDLSGDCQYWGGCSPAGQDDECQCCSGPGRRCGGVIPPTPSCCGDLSCLADSPVGPGVCTDRTCGTGDGCDTGGSCENGLCCNAEGVWCAEGPSFFSLYRYSPLPCCGGGVCLPSGEVVNGYLQFTCQVLTGRPCTSSGDCFPHACVNGFCN